MDNLITSVVGLGNSPTATDEVIGKLIGYLHHADGNVRRLACSALGKLGSSSAERPLLAMLDDDKPQVRQYALKALVRIATPFAIPIIQRILTNTREKPYNISLAARLLQQLPKKRVQSTGRSVLAHLSPDQQAIMDELRLWIRRPKGSHITVGGYAGTGKTTIAASLRNVLNADTPKRTVAFACFTGKASQVLKRKLFEQQAVYKDDTIGTLHSLIYKPRLDKHGRIKGWRRVSAIEADLIIIDEASMVTREMWQDIRSYGIPIIAIGDHGQLPPIGDEHSLMEKPDLRLETIHRHAQDNPILRVATLARTTGIIPYEQFSTTVLKVPRKTDAARQVVDRMFHAAVSDGLILCGRNATRVRINQKIRSMMGFTSDVPQVGERVICLKNNYMTDGEPIYNGMVGILKKIAPHKDHWYEADIAFSDEHRFYTGTISRHQFHKERYVEDVPGIHYKEIGDRFDFGYALTVHKSQGSQADRVLLFEEHAPYWEGQLWNRWLYTAVTRAVRELYIIA